jgi:hypothetical protein
MCVLLNSAVNSKETVIDRELLLVNTIDKHVKARCPIIYR